MLRHKKMDGTTLHYPPCMIERSLLEVQDLGYSHVEVNIHHPFKPVAPPAGAGNG